MAMKPVTPVTPSPGYYREERTWNQSKMRMVTKRLPCSFQEMLESANEERKRIEAIEHKANVRSIWEGPCFYGYTKEFMEWQLASRPTCGKEQRKFLDEVEKNFEVELDNIVHKYGESIIEDYDFDCDLQKVLKGE